MLAKLCQSKANKKKAGVESLITDKIEFKKKVSSKTKKILDNHALQFRSS